MKSNLKTSKKWPKENTGILQDVLHKGFQVRCKHPDLNKKNFPLDRGRTPEVYLPIITVKHSGLHTLGCTVSQSCPFIHSGHHSSVSSLISQRNSHINKKQEHHSVRRGSKQSNITMTMIYLGQGPAGTSRDEMKVLQQICGGENVCVFKGHLYPGEQFQFVSRRHRGFPFSASLFVNGIIAARISSCCEYRYKPGFQQGRGSCFKFTGLSGGKPCYRCASIHNSNGKSQLMEDGIKEKFLLSTVRKVENESCPSSPLFIPIGKERRLFGPSRKHSKDVSNMSTDSEELNSSVKVYRRQKRTKGKHSKRRVKKRSDMGENLNGDHMVVGQIKVPTDNSSMLHKTTLAAKNQGLNMKKPMSVKPHKKETHEIEKRTSIAVEGRHQLLEESLAHLCGESSTSELELSDESDINLHSTMTIMKQQEKGGLDHYANGDHVALLDNRIYLSRISMPQTDTQDNARLQGPNIQARDMVYTTEKSTNPAVPKTNQLYTENKKITMTTMSQEAPENEQDLQAQVEAMVTMLESCDLVEQLVLRNTGLTDDLLSSLVTALKSSPSEVVLINLNLNNIGPPGVQSLLNLMRLKPQIKGLLLFGNHLGDEGVRILLSGLAELQGEMVVQTTLQSEIGATQRVDIPVHLRETSGKATPLHTHITQAFFLLELDLGGTGISSEGLGVLSSYIRYHSQLKYLGLAHTDGANIAAWANLFDSLKTNAALNHIILDECHLGDEGVELFAKMLRDNQSLTKVDLDYNSFGERGGNAIIEVLLSKRQLLLSHLSLEGNHISLALMSKIQQFKLSSN